MQGVLCYGSVIGFMFALADLPEVQVAIAQPLVPALALGMSALFGGEALSIVSALGILLSISGDCSDRLHGMQRCAIGMRLR